MNATTTHIAMLSSIRTEKKEKLVDHPFHEMLSALQTTLEVEGLLDIFSVHLQPFVPHGSWSFMSDRHQLELRSGKKGRHSCTYTLKLENEVLGDLRFTRNKRFSENELATIEACLCRLLYPLRNALLYRQALRSALVDPLTQAGNRAALISSFRREWELARRYHAPLSLIVLDIDHFKRINDHHGHDAGDTVLREVAACLKDKVRASDIVFRYGGEEFVLLLANTDQHGASLLAERIRQALEDKEIFIEKDSMVRITASLGVATLCEAETQEGLFKRADQALYRAKGMGRNRVVTAADA